MRPWMLALLLLVGCAQAPRSVSAEMDSAPATTRAATTTTEEATTMTERPTTTRRATTTTIDVEDIYLDVVNGSVKGLYSDRQLVSIGRSFCEGIDELGAAAELKALVLAVVETGFDAGDAGVIAGAAVGAFCPEHFDEFQAAAKKLAG